MIAEMNTILSGNSKGSVTSGHVFLSVDWFFSF